MEAGVLSQYLKKVKQFAKENSSYTPAIVVRIVGTSDDLVLSACDGHCGITQHVPIVGKPIIGTCCINVFQLSKIVDTLNSHLDLNIIITDGVLIITSNKFKVQLSTISEENVFSNPIAQDWIEVKKTFFEELSVTIPDLEAEDKDYPIIRDKDRVYWANPRRLIVVNSHTESPEFLLDKSYAKKIFLDDFTHMAIEGKLVFFKNMYCEIFVPQFNSSRKLNLDGPLRIMREQHIYKCKVNIKEFAQVYDTIKSLADINDGMSKRIELTLSKNKATVAFHGSSFELTDVLYDGFDCSLLIPLANLQLITRPSFTSGEVTFTFKIAKDNRMFVTQRNDVFFVGGLWSEIN